MKTRRIILLIKLSIIMGLSAITIHYVLEQQQEQAEERLVTASEYQNQKITKVIPGGIMTGIYAETEGVLVLGTGDIQLESGTVTSPAEGVLEKGDYLVSCNGNELDSKEELLLMIEESEGQPLNITVMRDEEAIEKAVTPIQDGETYKLGVWVRDDIAGLGMLTYVTPQLAFGALGHCISDMDLGIEMNIREGTLHDCVLTDIKKGEEGSPGQLIGYISYQASMPEGYISSNAANGIKGELVELPEALKEVSYVPVAEPGEIFEGAALLICDVDGNRVAYDIQIEKIHAVFVSANKNFTIKVTDERLLELTGGIVQGMSGAPIIQDGKMVGAVTHVLVDDPTKGYGILIENMIGQ